MTTTCARAVRVIATLAALATALTATTAAVRSQVGDARPTDFGSGPRNLDSGLSEISIVFQAAVPKLVASKHTTSGVRRPSAL